MLFLFNRIAPYFLPVVYFVLVKLLFRFPDDWRLIILAIIVVSLVNFILLKFKNKGKEVFWLALWSLIYVLAGFAYILILEHTWIINGFLLGWSFVYWLYLEAVFHDFYKTNKTHIINLQNITLYANILIIFFLTVALDSFYIFLNFSWWQILSLLALTYYVIFYLACLKQGLTKREATIFSLLGAWILFQLFVATSFLPSSIYVLASIISLVYYILVSFLFLDHQGKLSKGLFWRYVTFFCLVSLLVLVTAAWF